MGPLKWLLALFALAVAAGCGQNGDLGAKVSDTACPAGVAQVGIGDGYFQNICGCDEPAGKLFLSPNTMTCTAPLGTRVVFQFLATRSLHQVIAVGTPSFPASPVSDPGLSDFPVRSHVIRPGTLGTYHFQDVTNSALAGQLVIR